MKKIVLALMLIPTLAFAQEEFDATKNFTKQSNITWVYADNVSAACNAERTKRGLPTFKQPSAACSFWTENTCYIITKRKFTLDDIGHEVLHCFAGKWH
jgi:hypothetical protein